MTEATPTVTLAFTDSPWEADRATKGNGLYHQIDAVSAFARRRDGLPLTIADTSSRADSIDDEDDLANALLIAAAPDLALALLAGLGIESPHAPEPIPNTADWEAMARAALKKAGVLA